MVCSWRGRFLWCSCLCRGDEAVEAHEREEAPKLRLGGVLYVQLDGGGLQEKPLHKGNVIPLDELARAGVAEGDEAVVVGEVRIEPRWWRYS